MVSLVGAGAVAVSGCGDEGCDPGLIQQASAFIDAHQSCDTDDDCVVVHDACGQIPGGFCGQLAMNRTGATSSAWRSFEAELHDCAPSSCTVCGAGLVPACRSGSCSDPNR
jgi:hypothetical protein